LEESDHYQGQPTYRFLVNYLKRHDFMGATVYQALEGYGESNRIHSADLLDVSSSLPLVVEVLEHPKKVTQLKDMLTETGMLRDRLVTEEKVRVARY
jgi:PII-like signaling protein